MGDQHFSKDMSAVLFYEKLFWSTDKITDPVYYFRYENQVLPAIQLEIKWLEVWLN
jgi:hypothetical protein